MLGVTTARVLSACVGAAVGVVALAGCAPANVAGTYTAAITSQANGCNLAGWMQGAMQTGIEFDVTQTGGMATGTVQGVAGAEIALGLGSNIFTGNVAGSGVDLTLHGTRSMSQGGCAYTINGDLHGNLTGDALQGSITYTAQTNGSPDCGALQGCTSVQDFNGSRPPAAH